MQARDDEPPRPTRLGLTIICDQIGQALRAAGKVPVSIPDYSVIRLDVSTEGRERHKKSDNN